MAIQSVCILYTAVLGCIQCQHSDGLAQRAGLEAALGWLPCGLSKSASGPYPAQGTLLGR